MIFPLIVDFLLLGDHFITAPRNSGLSINFRLVSANSLFVPLLNYWYFPSTTCRSLKLCTRTSSRLSVVDLNSLPQLSRMIRSFRHSTCAIRSSRARPFGSRESIMDFVGLVFGTAQLFPLITSFAGRLAECERTRRSRSTAPSARSSSYPLVR